MNNLNNLKFTSKRKFEENKTKLAFVAAGVATLGGTYFYGKSKGKVNLLVSLYDQNSEIAQNLTATLPKR